MSGTIRMGYLAAAAFVALAAVAEAADAPNAAVEALRKDVGSYGCGVLESPVTMEVYRIEPGVVKEAGPGFVGGHKILARSEKIPGGFGEILWNAIREGQSGEATKAKDCKFQPGVLVRYTSHETPVDVLLCFQCDQMEIVSFPPKSSEAIRVSRDFDDYRAALVRIVQTVFPEDPVVKGLKPWTWEPEAGAEKQVGKHGVKVLLAAQMVEVYRIKPEKGDPAAKERQVAGGYPVISRGLDLGPAFACRIVTLLLKGRTQAGFDKQCEFSPGVVFVVKSADDRTNLVLCFTCDELQAISYPNLAADSITGHFDMENVRAPWLELAKQALPADETIQGLGDKPK